MRVMNEAIPTIRRNAVQTMIAVKHTCRAFANPDPDSRSFRDCLPANATVRKLRASLPIMDEGFVTVI